MTKSRPGLTTNNAGEPDQPPRHRPAAISNVQAADGAVAIYSDGGVHLVAFEPRSSALHDRARSAAGPQGTLYGRNSIGGAINVLSKRPSAPFGAEIRATYGNYELQRLQATVTGPLAPGLNFRLNARREGQKKGYLTTTWSRPSRRGNVIKQYYLEAQVLRPVRRQCDGLDQDLELQLGQRRRRPRRPRGLQPTFPYNSTQEQQHQLST